MTIHDFSGLKTINIKTNGNKKTKHEFVDYDANDGKGLARYMLKYNQIALDTTRLSHANSCISEYLSCHIFKMLGFETQETVLGYRDEELVVGCKIFSINGNNLVHFADVQNKTLKPSLQGLSNRELSRILLTIERQKLFPQIKPIELKKFFWDMFIADAFIGNFDRHNDNWGFLVNNMTQQTKIAPIYDCASSLFPNVGPLSISENKIKQACRSSILNKGERIFYSDFLCDDEIDEECLLSLENIGPKIKQNMKNIFNLIDEIPIISDQYKKFYKDVIIERKNEVIDKALDYHYNNNTMSIKNI